MLAFFELAAIVEGAYAHYLGGAVGSPYARPSATTSRAYSATRPRSPVSADGQTT